MACRCGVVADLLALHPIATTYPDAHGLMPLHHAATANASAEVILELMLESSPAAFWADRAGWVPIHHAAAAGATDALIVLLNFFPQTASLCDRGSRTPLHVLADSQLHHCPVAVLAASRPSKDLLGCAIELLRVYPAAVDLPDALGQRPLQLARAAGASHQFCDLLRLAVDLSSSDGREGEARARRAQTWQVTCSGWRALHQAAALRRTRPWISLQVLFMVLCKGAPPPRPATASCLLRTDDFTLPYGLQSLRGAFWRCRC